MTAKEHKLLSSKIKEVAEAASGDASKAKELLDKTGFYTPTGKLKKACS